MFSKVPTFRLNLQPSSGESEKIIRKRHVTYSVTNSNLLLSKAEHCLRSGHTVSWEASNILRTSANWRNRRILEAWEINTCRNPLNRDDGMHLRANF